MNSADNKQRKHVGKKWGKSHILKLLFASLVLAFVCTNVSVIVNRSPAPRRCSANSTLFQEEGGGGFPKPYYVIIDYSMCQGKQTVFGGGAGSRFVNASSYLLDLATFVPISAVLVFIVSILNPSFAKKQFGRKQMVRILSLLVAALVVSSASLAVAHKEPEYICYSFGGRTAKVDRGFPIHYYQQGLGGVCGAGDNIGGVPQTAISSMRSPFSTMWRLGLRCWL